MADPFFFSGRDWFPIALGLSVAALALLTWSYGRTRASGGLRAACFSLKLVGVLALLFCLLEPLWNRQRAKPGANLFVVLADNSAGMQIKDRGDAQSRGELLRDVLTNPKGAWQAALAENFQVRRYSFDTRLQNV